MRIFLASFRKLVRRPATWVTMLLLIGLLVLVYLAVGATAKEAASRPGCQNALLLFLAIAVMAGVGLVIAFAIGVVAALAGAGLAGVSTGGLGDGPTLQALPEQLARGWIAIIEEAALGFAVATIARSQLAGVGVGIALYFGEQFAGLFLPDIVKYLPFQAASAVVAVGENVSSQQIVRSLEPNTALIVVAAWLIGALLVASLVTERAEIGG